MIVLWVYALITLFSFIHSFIHFFLIQFIILKYWFKFVGKKKG